MVCFASNADSVIMECGHGGICYECAIKMWKRAESCFLCRQPILQVLQIERNVIGLNRYPILNVISATRVKTCSAHNRDTEYESYSFSSN